jgi:hypothetical protein
MGLRQAAMQEGLKVATTDLESVVEVGSDKGAHCIGYHLYNEVPVTVSHTWQAARERFTHGPDTANEHLPDGWYWAKGDVPPTKTSTYLQSALPLLNQDVLAVEANPMSHVVYWREHGNNEDVMQFAKLLRELRDLDS